MNNRLDIPQSEFGVRLMARLVSLAFATVGVMIRPLVTNLLWHAHVRQSFALTLPAAYISVLRWHTHVGLRPHRLRRALFGLGAPVTHVFS